MLLNHFIALNFKSIPLITYQIDTTMASQRKLGMLLFFVRDKNKKSIFRIIKEIISLWRFKKEIPLYYISNLLYRKGIDNYKDFLSFKENKKILNWSYAKGGHQKEMVQNKLLFEQHLVKHNVTTPKIIFHNTNEKFTYGSEVLSIKTEADFRAFLHRVFKEQPIEKIFCKPVDAGLGRNTSIITKDTVDDLTSDTIAMMLTSSFIFQEVIAQHDVLNTINASSVNTLRIMSYKNASNEVAIISGFIRVGRKGAIVDNAHAGGIVIPINSEIGAFNPKGFQLIDNGGGIFTTHPDSGIVFGEVSIPEYDKVKALVKEGSTIFDYPLLGWDVAITPTGPVLVEANHNFHLLLSDRSDRGLINKPAFKSLYDEVMSAN